MFNMGGYELLIVLVVVVLLFGGKKIPELMRGVGKGLGEFRRGVDDAKLTAKRALEEDYTEPVVAEATDQTKPTPV